MAPSSASPERTVRVTGTVSEDDRAAARRHALILARRRRRRAQRVLTRV